MKIHSIHDKIGSKLRHCLTILGVAAIGAAACSTVAAQSAGGASSPGGASSAPATIRSGRLIQGNEAFTVVNAATVETAGSAASKQQRKAVPASGFSSPASNSVGQVAFDGGLFQHGGLHAGGCQSCGTGCGGTCGGAIAGGGIPSHGGLGYGAVPCPTCEPYRYATAEWLYMSREDEENFTGSEDEIGDFDDFEGAPRITVGAVPDCVHGYEFSFTGPLEWDDLASRVDGLGVAAVLRDRLPDDLTDGPDAGTLPDNLDNYRELSTFDDVIAQNQRYEADYFSVELSRTINAWHVAKLLYGVRYIDYSEDYGYSAFDGTNTALASSSTENSMIGGQVGIDLLYPIAQHAYYDFRGRAGAYLNLVDSDVRFSDPGLPADFLNRRLADFASSGDEEELAGMFEIGTGLRYELGENLTIRSGAELWYIAGLATAKDQFDKRERELDADDDVLFIGVNLGAEFRF